MYPLVESIRAEEGKLFLLEYHQKRMEKSYRHFFEKTCPFLLTKNLLLPNGLGKFKVRFVYNEQQYHVEMAPYTPRQIKKIKAVEVGDYTYTHKTTERTIIDTAFAQRGDCDDVLLLKNGWVTDLSYANLLLWDGQQWVTPQTPLLEGVQRQFLLDQQKIVAKPIHINDLENYSHFQGVNALNPFDAEHKILLNIIA